MLRLAYIPQFPRLKLELAGVVIIPWLAIWFYWTTRSNCWIEPAHSDISDLARLLLFLPLIEEIIFRQMLQTWLLRKTNSLLLTVSGINLIYGLLYLAQDLSWLAVAGMVGIGVYCSWLIERSHKLILVVSAHSYYNLCILVCYYCLGCR